jgi:histidine ammonia-lyase
MKFILHPGQLTLSDFRVLLDENTLLELDSQAEAAILASEKVIADVIAENKTVYGVNTGFGALASTRIHHDELETLQRSIVLSHAAGTGELLNDKAVRLILALKINSLARGFSGVKINTIRALIKLYNERIYPCIPSQGSVGASGSQTTSASTVNPGAQGRPSFIKRHPGFNRTSYHWLTGRRRYFH